MRQIANALIELTPDQPQSKIDSMLRLSDNERYKEVAAHDHQLKPELEALIRQDVLRGPYRSVDEFVERAVSQLHEQETWIAAQRDELQHKIEEGWLAASAEK